MTTALLIIFSITITLQVILMSIIIWFSKDDKKRKGKNDIETDIYYTENELYEIDKQIHKLEAEFKCVHSRLDYLHCQKENKSE